MAIPVSEHRTWTISENQFALDTGMDEVAFSLVQRYIQENLIPRDSAFYAASPKIFLYMVWKAKILQNWKYLISTDAPDSYYYEVTYNGDKKEWYLDAYAKTCNVCITVTKGAPAFSDITLNGDNSELAKLKNEVHTGKVNI